MKIFNIDVNKPTFLITFRGGELLHLVKIDLTLTPFERFFDNVKIKREVSNFLKITEMSETTESEITFKSPMSKTQRFQ